MTTSLSVGLHVCFCDMQHGKTALHMAAEIKNAEIIDVLASFRNIDVNRTNSNGETALYVSSRVVHTATASHLLAAGADANAARPDDGSTPLHCACQDGDGSALVGLLLDDGARPDAGRRSTRSDVTGITPLHDTADAGVLTSALAVGSLSMFLVRHRERAMSPPITTWNFVQLSPNVAAATVAISVQLEAGVSAPRRRESRSSSTNCH